MSRYIQSGRKDYSHLSPILYHTVARNLDLYNYKQTDDWKALKMFEIAYKATLFQIECGEDLLLPPPSETLIESKPVVVPKTDDQIAKGSEIIGGLLAMFDKPEQKTLTPAEIADNERLERINGT